ncbi:hypothetical protein BBJ29_004620 [Phytophthora kernoviae]|uniref:Uncharacterized protein n=1 Tax=Phytophthora kernoviae TaxID=325452 RepID=A0A3F2RXR8_9STRA|nr:hypothetical protein BBJ29_004620 [Phytophthora kernoviae]RLN66254.1 hypothetical protein BBP00_00002350 [Phytophthora kernoviae]
MAMPRHVPSTKPKPSVVTRLRLELNQEVPKHVAKAVDAVCDAFEEELMPVYPPRDVGVNNYELFYDCCRRLAKYIETNMTTTPGFLEQMDRIILACHSGATGSVLRSVMTKDLPTGHFASQFDDFQSDIGDGGAGEG